MFLRSKCVLKCHSSLTIVPPRYTAALQIRTANMAARGAELQAQNPFSKENYYGQGGAGAAKTPECRSTLHIKAATGQFRWQVRFVVLDAATRALLSFKSEEAATSDSATVKKILFSRVQRWDGKPNGIELTTPLNRVYHMYADSTDICDRWMHALESVLQTDASKGRARLARLGGITRHF